MDKISLKLAQQVAPWNLNALKKEVPDMRWVNQEGPTHSLVYAGEVYKGKPTEVFAVYASPVTLGEAKEPLIKDPSTKISAHWIKKWERAEVQKVLRQQLGG